ncbi:hypothetical protein RAS2_16350 [Phycisphaerae bacterium RAS2]|nr:hypothetical protein RAS2_16350 [Phycisphaerae bacterium RAS2]
MNVYSACERCTAKWFGDEKLDGCPRCGSINLLHTQAVPPWEKILPTERKSPRSRSTVDQPLEANPDETH